MSYIAEGHLSADQLLRLECVRINPTAQGAARIYDFIKSSKSDAEIIRAARAVADTVNNGELNVLPDKSTCLSQQSPMPQPAAFASDPLAGWACPCSHCGCKRPL